MPDNMDNASIRLDMRSVKQVVKGQPCPLAIRTKVYYIDVR
jgi:hypothetical protein